MGYLVLFSIEDAKSAHFFNSRNDAVDFINTCCEENRPTIRELRHTENDDEYRALLITGQKLTIKMVPKDSRSVKYDLTYIRNSDKPITRRFSNRDNAVLYAHKLLEEDLEADADPGEDERFEWILDDPDRWLYAHLIVTLVILGDINGKDDYKTLKCSSSASKEEVKSAFRKLALKYHPDVGGDAKKFAEINAAYKRIMDGNPMKQSRKVEEEYSCFDISYLLKKIGKIVDSAKAELRIKVRSKASSLMVSGLIMFMLGFILFIANNANTQPGSEIIFFSGLLLVGVWRFLKGGYYYLYPDSLVDKALKQLD
ncbi:MAG: DnaJ domain-containing protein [Clostridium sp.]|nr:DnaJ domain-containing protein [Clostridium sp.]